jgi:hypothetical protein
VKALCVTEKILTIGRAPEDLVIEKPNSRLGSKPAYQSRRDPGNSDDLGLSLPAQFGDQLEPPLGAAPENR